LPVIWFPVLLEAVKTHLSAVVRQLYHLLLEAVIVLFKAICPFITEQDF
jgi:hypothetical protein